MKQHDIINLKILTFLIWTENLKSVMCMELDYHASETFGNVLLESYKHFSRSYVKVSSHSEVCYFSVFGMP